MGNHCLSSAFESFPQSLGLDRPSSFCSSHGTKPFNFSASVLSIFDLKLGEHFQISFSYRGDWVRVFQRNDHSHFKHDK